MVRRRIGNDIDIEWGVYRGDTPEDFTGKSVKVFIIERCGKKQQVDNSSLSISGSTISFTWKAVNQYSIGNYSIILEEYIDNELCNTVDIADAIELVANTALEDGDADYIADSSVTFRSDFNVVFNSIDKAYSAAQTAAQQAVITDNKTDDLITATAAAEKAYNNIKEILDSNFGESTGGGTADTLFEEDENGDLVPKPKADGTARGIWTNSFISAGGRNTEGGGGEGGLTQITIRFADIPTSDQGYTSENGEVVLPNYPTIEDFDLSAYLTKVAAIDLYYSKNAGTQLETTVSGINTMLTDFKTLFDSMFAVEDGTIKAKMGLWSDSFISAGGKNTEEGGGGGITTFTIKIGDDEYSLENGVVTLPAYPTVPDVSGFILKTTADTLYQPKGDYLLGTTLYALSDAVGGDALNAQKLGGNKPSHYATAQSVTDLTTTLTTFKDLFDSMFALDEDGYIQAKLGLWTNSFLSAGGKNTEEGSGGGGLTEFSIVFNGTTYNSDNGTATILGTYATSDDVTSAVNTSKGYTDTAIANLINGAPSTLDTLKEIADAFEESQDVIEALNAAIGTKASQSDVTTLQSYFTDGIAKEAAKVSNPFKITFNGTTYEYNGSVGKEINFSAANIVSALGTTAVNRAKGDEDGTNIKAQFANTNTKIDNFITLFNKFFTLDETDGSENIKANFGLWTDSYLSAGGKNEEGGGGGEGITTFTIRFADIEESASGYPLNNGEVVLPNYPDLTPYATTDALTKGLASKQNVISDLETIRSGATLGATALQRIPSEYITESELDAKGYALTTEIPTALPSPKVLKFGEKTYDGSAEKTITASDLGALTSHQTIYTLTFQAGTFAAKSFTANAENKTINIPTTTAHISEGTNNLYYTNARVWNTITGRTTGGTTLTANRVLVSNANGKVAVSDITSTELEYLDGVTSAIQTQFTNTNTKIDNFIELFNKFFTLDNTSGSESIQANYGLWTDSYLSAGGQNTSGGGGGGGLTEFSIIINGTTYDSENGIALVSEQLQPLITANNKLAYSLISGTPNLANVATSGAYSDLSGTPTIPTTLPNPNSLSWSGYSSGSYDGSSAASITIPTSLPASDVYAWAKAATKPTYTTTEVAEGSNLYFTNARAVSALSSTLSRYLPLSGGTVGRGTTALAAFNVSTANSAGYPAIGFYSGDTRVGLIRIEGDRLLRIYDSAFNATATVLTSINYSNYALPINLSIPFESTVNAYGYGYISGGWATNGAALMVGANSLYRMSIQGESNSTLLYRYCYNGTWGDARYVAFTDSNVASATKLETARTIWGQSFDGTGDIVGADISLNRGTIYWHNDSSSYHISCPVGSYGGILEYQAYSGHRFLGGNVLIGTTTDSGAKLRIQTNRADTFTWNLGSLASKSDMALEFCPDGSNIYGLYTAINYHSGDVAMQVGRSDGLTNAYNLCLQPLGGNVLIGTTYDSGFKLQVEGSFTLSNELHCGGWLRTYGDRGWYNETYGGGIHMTDTNFVKTYGNKAFSASYYQMNYTDGVEIASSGDWYRVWEGNYYGSIILSLTHSWSNNQTDNLIFSISTGYEYGASSGITLLSRNIGTNTYQAIRVVYDGDIGKHCVEVFIGNTGSNIHWVSGIGHGVFHSPTLVTSTNLNQRCMMYIDSTATIQSSNNAVITGNISASGAITAGTASDIRLKDNIQSITENRAIEVLMALNPITYQWNDIAKELGGFEGISQGFIAQEYEEIIPNSGRAIWEEYRAIDYNMAIPYIVKVEQNHEQRIKQLEEENKELKQELETIKKQYNYGI